MDSNLKREIIMDNYLNPVNKEVPQDLNGYDKINSNNESCIDNIDIYMLVDNNVIKDIKFDGEACAVSTAATSIMIKLFLNKTIKEAYEIVNNYENMINERKYDSDILGEANCFDEIYKQENRKHCAMLPYVGIRKLLDKYMEN